MKLIMAALCAFILPLSSHALDAKLTLQNNLYDEGAKYRLLFGVGLYQKLIQQTALNIWTGTGSEPFDHRDDADWFIAKGQVDMYFGNLTIAPGYQYRQLLGENLTREYFYLRIDYKLF